MKDNLVQKMEFQIEIEQEAHFDQVAKEIPDIVTRQFEYIIESCLRDLNLDKQVFIIDKLVLDLGNLPLSDFKNELSERFKTQFVQEIRKQLLTNQSAQISEEELSFVIFNLFITQGVRPWWLVNQVRDFGGFAQRAFSLSPKKFTQNIKYFIRRPVYRTRVVTNIPEDLLINVLRFDKNLDRPILIDAVYSVKELFKRQYRHWNESKISAEFKKILLFIFLNPNKLDQPWKLELAILEAIQQIHPDLALNDPRKNLQNKRIQNLSKNGSFDSLNHNQSQSTPYVDFELLQNLQFYLQNGYQKPGVIPFAYKFQDINRLFAYLIDYQLEQVVALLLASGKRNAIKKRFLGTISQILISRFFALVAPSKQKLLEWVVDVFAIVQEEYRPINQTFINIKKSINEITFELFLSQKLTSFSDENYLRYLFKQTAQKYSVSYRDLLFFTIKSLATGADRYKKINFYDLLASIYAKDILKSKRIFSIERILFAAKSPQEISPSENYSKLVYLTNLSLTFSKSLKGQAKSQANEWLKTKFITFQVIKTADLVEVWEEFAIKFGIPPQEIVLFLLVQKHKNPKIDLSNQSFQALKRKYQILGVFPNRKPDLSRLIVTLEDNKKLISQETMRAILSEVDIESQIGKLDLEILFNLVQQGRYPLVKVYLKWLEGILSKNKIQHKKIKVYNWLFHFLLDLPKKDFNLLHLQQKTSEFLGLEDVVSAITLGSIQPQDGLSPKQGYVGGQEVFENITAQKDTQTTSSQTLDALTNLFLSFARPFQVTTKSQAKEFLKSQYATFSMRKTSDLVHVWEAFAGRFGIHPFGLVLFILLQKHKNPKIELPTQFFQLLKKKYQISGVYANRRPDLSRLISTLDVNKKLLSRASMLDIISELDLKNGLDRLDLRQVLNLILQGGSPIADQYLKWLDEVLVLHELQSQKKKVQNWFFYFLLRLPKKDLKLSYFKMKTEEFLGLDDLSGLDLDNSKPVKAGMLDSLWPSKNNQRSVPNTYIDHFTSKSLQPFFRIVEILGKESVYQIFVDAPKFGEKILYQVLTTKYEVAFFELLKNHQFNKELRDFLLNQAPAWLKKDLLQFINKTSISSWSSTINMLRDYFEKTKWLKSKDGYLIDFIEKTLWEEIFESGNLTFQELVLLIMQRAMRKEQLTSRFWDDFGQLKSAKTTLMISADLSFSVQELAKFWGSEFWSYVEIFGQKNIKSNTSIQILEDILYDFEFPIGHSFEGYLVEDFTVYLKKLIKSNRKQLPKLLSKVNSPFLMQRFLGLLDDDVLKILVEETHASIGHSGFLKRVEAIFLFFRIYDKSKINVFYRRWIEILQRDSTRQINLLEMYAGVIRLMMETDLMTQEKFVSQTDWKLFFERVSIGDKDRELFFDLISNNGNKAILKGIFLALKKINFNFLDYQDPFQLIYYPNKLSLKDYINLIHYLFENNILTKNHQDYLNDWVKFAVHYQSKKYLQILLKLYFLKEMHAVSTVSMLKLELVPAMIAVMNSDLAELRLFLSRLSYLPNLVSGVGWVSPPDLGKIELEEFKSNWENINRRYSPSLIEPADHEIGVSFYLSQGNDYFLRQKTPSSSLVIVRNLIRLTPFNELFEQKIHVDRFADLLEIKSVDELYAYFASEKDKHFKNLRAKKFLLNWIRAFFDQSNSQVQSKFLILFHTSFYQLRLSEAQQFLIFLQDFHELKDAQVAFRMLANQSSEEFKDFYLAYPAFFGTEISRSDAAKLNPLELIQLFLETGILPKGLSGLDQLAKELESLKNNELNKLRALFHSNLQSEYRKENFQKLAAHLDEAWFFDLIHPQLAEHLSEITIFLHRSAKIKFLEDLRINQKMDRLIWIAFRWAIKPIQVKNSLEILLGLIEKWLDLTDNELIVNIFNSDKKLPLLLQTLKNSSSKLKKILEQEATEEEKEEKKIIPVELEPVDYGEGVSIANAGLVLFWPFFGRFFNALGMLGRDGMKGDEIRERAIQLLQYIATGKTEFEEWDLTLNKILCGAPPDFPVGTQIELTEEERELCEKLILGTIFNWEKMKGTRLETFQETFVRREGMLYRKENRWELIVENKAYDVLMDTLTWNITMINLSWMTTRINVQWR